MKRILFVTDHRRNSAPNQRFRFEQYIPFLEQSGFRCDVSPLLRTAAEANAFYNGSAAPKIWLGAKMALRRLKDVIRGSEYDIIVIVRQAFVARGSFFERMFRRSRARIAFDFDDAIWLNAVSEKNKTFAWLKDAGKTAEIISLSDLVIAGNDYLAQFAHGHNRNVTVVPTTIDTNSYTALAPRETDVVTIGWSGSRTTIEHFRAAIPALSRLRKKYGSRIRFMVIGDGNFHSRELDVKGVPWKVETEIDDLRKIDIGIMPLPDDEWTRGKCGLKGLQYMALGIPTVMSPVGVNSAIIDEGRNGYLASSDDEWVEKCSRLVDDLRLRERFSEAGRQTVVEKYSVESQKLKYVQIMNGLLP